MKKNNYKPRIVRFDGVASGHYKIDTRKGCDGFYPGDVIRCDACVKPGERIIVGVDVGYAYVLWFAEPTDGGKVHNLMFTDKSEFKLIKRHAQHLIDNGAMIQVGDE